MKCIIAGGRRVPMGDALRAVRETVEKSGWHIDEVVSGGARGVDAAGEAWARVNSVPCRVIPADWDKHGKAAGPIRNRQMAEYADALILIWDGQSRGSASMLREAERAGLMVWDVSAGAGKTGERHG